MSSPQAAPGPGPAAELPVVETFHSLQGEGLHAGRSAFFIRLGGCSVGCAWCDTKHSWPSHVHPLQSPAQLAAAARQAAEAGAGFVVLTGGEPLHHDLNALCTALTAASQELPRGPLPLHLETSGVDPLSGQFDWITLSPKRHRPPRPELLQVCHELKAVVHDEEDLAFALAMAAAAGQRQGDPGPALLLQPGWDDEQGLELAIAHARHHPEWRLSLQGHKWLQIR